jgi:acyl carrier protein
MEHSPARLALFEALKAGARSGFNDERRRQFLDGGSNFLLADLDMDSLGEMEFCIAVELSTGVTLLPSQLAELASTDAIEHRIREKIGERAGSGG